MHNLLYTLLFKDISLFRCVWLLWSSTVGCMCWCTGVWGVKSKYDSMKGQHPEWNLYYNPLSRSLLNVLDRLVTYLVQWFLGEAAELPELQLDACNFSHSAVWGPMRWVCCTFPNVHIRVGDLRRCVEGWHQPGTNIFLWRNGNFMSIAEQYIND